MFVTDFERSLDFYTQTLGMEIDYTDKTSWAQFETGVDVSLAIEKCEADRVAQGGKLVGRFVGVTLMVEDIARQYELLTDRGVEFAGPPAKQDFGGTLAHLKDPDGNVLTLMEEAR